MTDLRLAGPDPDNEYHAKVTIVRMWVGQGPEAVAVMREFKDNPELWDKHHASWTGVCKDGFQLSPQHVGRLITAFEMPGDESERSKRKLRLENAGEPADEPDEPDVAAVLDARGEPVTQERFQRIFAHSARFGAIMSALKSIKAQLSELDEMPAGEVLHQQIKAIERDRRNIYAAVKFSKPWAVCPYCGGSASHSECGGCKGRGWVTKEVFDQSPAK